MSLTEKDSATTDASIPQRGSLLIVIGIGITAIGIIAGITLMASGANGVVLFSLTSLGVILALFGFGLRIVALLEHIAKKS